MLYSIPAFFFKRKVTSAVFFLVLTCFPLTQDVWAGEKNRAQQ